MPQTSGDEKPSGRFEDHPVRNTAYVLLVFGYLAAVSVLAFRLSPPLNWLAYFGALAVFLLVRGLFVTFRR